MFYRTFWDKLPTQSLVPINTAPWWIYYLYIFRSTLRRSTKIQPIKFHTGTSWVADVPHQMAF